MKEYETKLCETVCTEFTVSKKKWFCLSVYRPPPPNNVVTFFKELTDSLKSDCHLPKKNFIICFNDGPSKMMKNAFCFFLKALFIPKIIKFLS